MDVLKATINGIRNIEKSIIELPLESGIYAFVGNNGCGKSTILLCLAQLISRYHLSILKKEDFRDISFIEFEYNGRKDKWTEEKGFWSSSIFPNTIGFKWFV